MQEKHVMELLIEASKNISSTISKLESDSLNKQTTIDQVNTVIRQLDQIVEYLERK